MEETVDLPVAMEPVSPRRSILNDDIKGRSKEEDGGRRMT